MTFRWSNASQKPRPYWLWIAAAPLVPALFGVLRLYVDARLSGTSVRWHDLLFGFLNWVLLAALIPLIYLLARRYPIRRKRLGRVIGTHTIAALGFSLVWSFLGVLLAGIFGRLPQHEPLLRSNLTWVLFQLPVSMFLYALTLGCFYAVIYYRESRERESQQARLSAQLAEAKLGALRMQLNPHFLFNSLNAITVLVRDHNTTDAAKILELLSGILRQVLHESKRQLITLDEELGFIEKYLAIEQIRFSDRLQVRWDIEDRLRDALVPEFILQPLVENAVRHGTAQRTDGGVIEIVARESNGKLLMSVSDNGPGYRTDSGIGVGLKNTSERLETLFGQAGQLEVVAAEGGGTIASVGFPLRVAEHE